MKKTFQVPKFQPFSQRFVDWNAEDVPMQSHVEIITIKCDPNNSVSDRFVDCVNSYIKRFYYKPECVLIGWRNWLILGFEVSNYEYPHKLDEFYYTKILVDSEPNTLKCIPQTKNVMIHVS